METLAGCPACGNAAARSWFVSHEHGAFHCRRCGFLFARPLPGSTPPRYEGEYFDSFVSRDQEGQLEPLYRRVLDGLARRLNGRRLLDAGCGAGYFLKFAKGRGWQVSGLDVSATAVEFARAKLGVHATVADLNTFKMPVGA